MPGNALTAAHRAALLELLGTQTASHLLVNPAIQGALSKDWTTTPEHAGENTVLSALRTWWGLNYEGPLRWSQHHAKRGDQYVVDFGFDLANRPKWLQKNENIKYTGLRLPGHQEDACRGVQDFDWSSATAAELRATVGNLAPDWILAIDVLDYLQDPIPFLQNVAELYGEAANTGHMLVATRSKAFFDGLLEPVPETARHMRTRRTLRRAFRDAGLEVLGEFSPPLPDLPDILQEHYKEPALAELRTGKPPLHFWILRMNMTQTLPVERHDLEEWLEELEQEGAWHPRFRGLPPNASAQLVLRSVLDKHEQLAWRRVLADRPLLTARNTGGRLFVVRSGSVVAYHPEGRTEDGRPFVRVTRGPNSVVGELEVFNQDGSFADRLYMWSLYGAPPNRDSTVKRARAAKAPQIAATALEVPAAVVHDLLIDSKVLKNPFVRDLRAKVLDAELGLNHELKFSQKKKAENKTSKRAKSLLESVGIQALVDKDTHIYFVGRYGPRRVPKVAVAQVACLLERATEFDREWGLPEGPQGRILLFGDIHESRSEMYGVDSRDQTNRRATLAAVQFLERCYVIRPLCLNTSVSGAKTTLDEAKRPRWSREQITTSTSTQNNTEHINHLRSVASDASKNRGERFPRGDKKSPPTLEELFKLAYPAAPDAYETVKDAFLTAPGYCMVVVRSEYALRRMSMELSGSGLMDLLFLREALPRPAEEFLRQEDLRFVQHGIDHLYRRTEARRSHVDSSGRSFFVPA